MVRFRRIPAPAAWERIIEADPNRTYLEFREDQGNGYWINTIASDINTCLLNNDHIIFSEKRDGIKPTQEFFGMLFGVATAIQMIEETETVPKDTREQREAPLMNGKDPMQEEKGILQSTWEWLFK